ncbi:hypothetical protein ACYOEI_09875 [Singulisphaera rosea]
MLVVATWGFFLALGTEGSRLIQVTWARTHMADQSARYEQGYRSNAQGFAAEARRLADEARLSREAERDPRTSQVSVSKILQRHTYLNKADRFTYNALDLERASSSYRVAASRSIEMATYYAGLKQKYSHSAQVPWRPHPPDPHPPKSIPSRIDERVPE